MATPNTYERARSSSLVRKNIRLASSLWRDELRPLSLPELKKLTRNSGLSIASGEVLLLDGKWYVTHAGLLRIALRRRCSGIRTVLQERLSDPIACRWVFKATVYKSPRSRGFVGYGDADPSNVSPLVRGAEMRIAETRAVNRALRKAYGIGLCSVEELGAFSRPTPDSHPIASRACCWQWKWFESQPAPTARPTLPSDPAVQSRPHTREGLRRGLLRHRHSQGSQSRSGRILHLPARQGGERGSGCFDLQTQLLCSAGGGAAMRRHIPGLHAGLPATASRLEGMFLVRVDAASYRWHPHKPFLILRFVVLEPESLATRSFSGRLYCSERALWKLNWFLRDFGYDPDLLGRDQVDEKALVNLRGVLRTSLVTFNGRSYQNLEAFAPASEWEELSCAATEKRKDDDLQPHTD